MDDHGSQKLLTAGVNNLRDLGIFLILYNIERAGEVNWDIKS